jgi:hypothetical protein
MTQFHVLSRDYLDPSFAYLENQESGKDIPAPVCPKCGEELCPSADGPDATYSVKRKKLGDLISDGISIALSARCARAFRQSGLIGLEIRQSPLNLINSRAEYFLAIPKATCTRLDEPASGIVIHAIRGCPFCRVIAIDKIDRAVIDVKTWDGEDVFCCGNLFSEIIVSQKFCDFIRENHFSNFRFTAAESFCFDYRI